jgi:hypothetical protein
VRASVFFYVVSARKEEWVLLGGFGIMYAQIELP